jgi:nitrosocyanin
MMRVRAMLVLAAAAAVLGPMLGRALAQEKTVEMTVVNVEYEGTKIWVPSTIVAKKGDKVKIKLINNVPSDPNQHGFKIAGYNVEAVVTRGEPKTVEFVADKTGIFQINCQLHPAHVGGQLLVIE